jgi:YHS domain-containing protein
MNSVINGRSARLRFLPLVGFALFITLMTTGCASTPAQSVASGGPHAECLVCKKNADLACVDIAVTDKTPRAAYGGETYYFCSDECRHAFEKNPAMYAGK